MNNNKDNDLQVREDIFTDGLREALRRMEVKRQPMEVPDDFLENVMNEIGQKPYRKTWRFAITAFATAASITLLLTCHFGKDMSEQQTGKEKLLVAHTTVLNKDKMGKQDMTKGKTTLTVLHPQQVAPVRKKTMKRPKATATTLITDSIACLAQTVERELERVGDECYMQRLSKTISSDPKLSRMVNEFINVASDTLQTIVCMKAI